jgi:hypothetical protein
MKRNFADSVFASTSLPNLRNPPWAMAPSLQECKKPTIDILRKSDSVTAQALPVPKAGGDRSVLQPKAGGDHNVPQHQKATFEGVERFIEANAVTKTVWLNSSDETYSMVDKACQLAIEAKN